MAYTPQRAIDFWFEFDDTFLPGPRLDPEVKQAYAALGFDLDLPLRAREESRQAGTYPQAFSAALAPFGAAFATLAAKQLAVLDRHFGGDAEARRRAFEDFGMGVLFDGRREAGRKVHMMDTGGPTSPPIGYHRWHAYARACAVLGQEAERWEELDRVIGLAWAVQSRLKPRQDRPDNPPMNDADLDPLRARWLALSPAAVDDAFDSFPYPAGDG